MQNQVNLTSYFQTVILLEKFVKISFFRVLGAPLLLLTAISHRDHQKERFFIEVKIDVSYYNTRGLVSKVIGLVQVQVPVVNQ